SHPGLRPLRLRLTQFDNPPRTIDRLPTLSGFAAARTKGGAMFTLRRSAILSLGLLAAACNSTTPAPPPDMTAPGCHSNNDCAGATPHCDTTQQACVECVTDDHCGSGKVCHASACAVGCNAGHPACPQGQVCYLSAGACVACISDGDCKDANLSRCEPKSN